MQRPPNKALKIGHEKRGLGRSLRSRRLARRFIRYENANLGQSIISRLL